MPDIPSFNQDNSPKNRTMLYVLSSILIVALLAGGIGYFLFRNNGILSTKSNSPQSGEPDSVTNSNTTAQNPSDIACDPQKVYEDLDEALKEPLKVCRLDLTGKNLSSLPQSITQLQNLKAIYLTSNIFTQFPSQLLSITSLEEIYLPGNNISSLPKEIGTLSKLTILNFTNNQISSLPEEITGLRNLQKLLLSRNRLTTIPEGLDALSLDQLELSHNEFSDAEIARISALFPSSVLSISRIEPTPTPLADDSLIKVAPKASQ